MESPPEPPSHRPASADSIAGQDGGEAPVDRAFRLVYDELRAMAGSVGAGRSSATYSPTVLVHEAYLKLTRSPSVQWSDHSHFMRLAARAMRQVLVDAATERMAEKRGGGELVVTLTDAVDGESLPLTPDALLELHLALDRLREENDRAAQVVECRYFGGLTAEETADALGIAVPTVARDWRFARAWLTRELTP